MALFYRIKSFLKKPQNLILCILLLALFVLTCIPLITIVQDTFTVHPAEARRLGQEAGSSTLSHWSKVFVEPTATNTFYRPFFNSLLCSLGASALAILLGGYFAWLVARTDLRWKSLMSSLFIFPYIMPSWTIALAWRNIFKNTLIGGSQGIFTALTGLATPDWLAYGPLPIMVVQGLHYVPFAYILIGGILRNMDASLEEAAMILKASRWQMITRITIPIVTPAILSTFLLTFSSTMSSFAVPTFLGLPVRYYVLTTQLYRTLNGTSPGQGYVIALALIILGVSILLLNQRIIGTRRSYTTVTGKSANISLVSLRKARTPLSAAMMLLVLCISLIPLVSFALESLLRVPGKYTLDNLTLQYWIGTAEQNTVANSEPGILINPNNWRVLWNSLRLSLACALGAGTLGFLAGYAIVRSRGTRLSKIVDNLAFFPYLMPSMAFGVIYLSMFSQQRGPIPPLYGTFTILVLIGVVKYLPFATRAGINAMLQLSKEIEEAGLVQGIGWFKRMRRLVVPIQKSSVISGYLLPFTSSMRELSLFVLLVTPATRVLTTMLYYYNEKGWTQYSNAINLLIVLIVLLLNGIVTKLTGASIDKGIGG